MTSARYHLHLIDYARIADNSRRVTTPLRGLRLAFLAVLACADQPQSRQAVSALLWPDKPWPQVGASLSQILHLLTREYPSIVGLIGNTHLYLPSAITTSDVGELRCARRDDIIEHFTGKELMPAVFLPNNSPFEDWVASIRDELRERIAERAWIAASNYESVGDTRGALRMLDALSHFRPYEEGVVRRKAVLLARTGEVAEALLEINSFKAKLTLDLGVSVSQETRDLLTTIITGVTP
jgi:DNA-binding SARP family transcriptional activator